MQSSKRREQPTKRWSRVAVDIRRARLAQRKLMQEQSKPRLESRLKENYRKRQQQLAFHEGFEYADGLRPGAELMGQLGVRERPGEKDRVLRGALKVWIPDTIVVSRGEPVWLYTCAQGYLRRSTDFTGKQVMERLCDLEYPKDVVAVHKVPKYDRAGHFGGNRSVPLDSDALFRVLSNETNIPMAADGRGARMAHPDDMYAMVIQRFIKGKGHKSHIIRTKWTYGKPACAWMMTNALRYDDKRREPHEALRLLNHPERDFAVNTVRMTRQAMQEAERLTLDLRDYLQGVVKLRLVELVVDALRDDLGNLWFIKVQAYRTIDPSIPNAHPLTGGATGGQPRELPPMPGSDDQRPRPGRQRPDTTDPRTQYKCKFCSCFYGSDSTQYMMTTQMILETSAHLKQRLGRLLFARLFAGHSAGDLGADVSRLYHAHFVCALCYGIYQAELELAQSSNRFADGLGVPLPPELQELEAAGAGPESALPGGQDGPDAKLKKSSPKHFHAEDRKGHLTRRTTMAPGRRSSLSSALSPVLQQPEFCRDLGAEAEPEREAGDKAPAGSKHDDFVSTMPSQVTLCRVMVAVHELHELPDHLFTSNKASDVIRPLFDAIIRFSVLGRECEVPIDLYECTFHPEGDRDLSNLQVQQVRLFSFFAENTPLHGPLPSSSGFTRWISEEQELVIQLCVRPKVTAAADPPPFEMLGKCHLPLQQFKSAFLKRTDMMIPLGFSSELCEMRVSIGVERTRDDFNASSVDRVRLYKGVFVAEDHFFPCEPLPEEWIAALVSHDADSQSIKRQRKSYETLRGLYGTPQAADGTRRPDVGSPLSVPGSPAEAEAEALALDPAPKNSSANAYCLQVTLGSARNLPLREGWPKSVYAQYCFRGEWFTTGIAQYDALDRSFAFDYKHKHYVRTTEEGIKEVLAEIEYLPVVVMSPFTRVEASLLELFGIAFGTLGTECFERSDIVECLEGWQALRQQNLDEGPETGIGAESEVEPESDAEAIKRSKLKAALHAHAPDQLVTLVEVGTHLRKLWGEDALADTTTLEEALYAAMVLLRLHVTFSEMVQESSWAKRMAVLEGQLDLILHPSHRRSIEPELRDKVAQMRQAVLETLEEAGHAAGAGAELGWPELTHAFRLAFGVVERSPIKETFEPAYTRPHAALMSHMSTDRLCFATRIALESLVDREDTIDGTYHLGEVRPTLGRRPAHISCYAQTTAEGGVSAPESPGTGQSSQLPSLVSTSTCTFTSLESSGSEAASSQDGLDDDAGDETQEASRCPWERVLPLSHSADELEQQRFSPGEVERQVEGAMARGVLSAEQRTKMLEVCGTLSSRGLANASLEDLLRVETEQLARPKQAPAQDDECETVRGLLGSPRSPEGASSPLEIGPTDAIRVGAFPAYLHANLVLYRSVYIMGEKERPDPDKVKMTLPPAVATLLEGLKHGETDSQAE